jgi:hypothetical protein
MTINGVDAGGMMSARIEAGYDEILNTEPDGLEAPISDRGCQFVRGTIVSQDWIEAVNLLTGTVSTYIFYERRSGVAAATGYIEHTLANPVIHNIRLEFRQGGYATVTFDFECKADDETSTIADMWVMADTQPAPTYITAARGGWRVQTALLGAVNIYHVTAFSFSLTLGLVKACNDADVAYTAVDARLDGSKPTGSITFQDSSIATIQLRAPKLLLAARASLVVTVIQSSGASAKVITIAGVVFDSLGSNQAANAPFSDFTMPFRVANNTTTQLTLAGTNKIIAIA